MRIVVLRPAIDIIERFGIIDRDLIKLCDRQIVDETPCARVVPTFIQTAIRAEQDIFWISGVTSMLPHLWL